MAVWQATFFLVSRGALRAAGERPVNLDEGWWEPRVSQEVAFALDKRLREEFQSFIQRVGSRGSGNLPERAR